jgi:hypothetical protein
MGRGLVAWALLTSCISPPSPTIGVTVLCKNSLENTMTHS